MEKKFSLVVIAILILAFGIYIYVYPPTKNESESTKTLFAKLDDNINESKPSTLRMSLIKEMVDNYRQHQLKSIENAPENGVKEDAYSILFDLDTLKKFISDIEKGVKKVQPTADSKLAIRMYYAAYPSKLKWNEPGYHNLSRLLDDNITKLYEKKHTLIMVPVIKTEKGIFADFNPFDKGTYQGFPRQAKAMQLLRNAPDTTEIPALNHGQLIPPASHSGEAF